MKIIAVIAFIVMAVSAHAQTEQHKPESISILSVSTARMYCKTKPESTAPIYRDGGWIEATCTSVLSASGELKEAFDYEADLLLRVLDLRIDSGKKRDTDHPRQ